jgi:hypothetical protein
MSTSTWHILLVIIFAVIVLLLAVGFWLVSDIIRCRRASRKPCDPDSYIADRLTDHPVDCACGHETCDPPRRR